MTPPLDPFPEQSTDAIGFELKRSSADANAVPIAPRA
jgi:hypothetical protein